MQNEKTEKLKSKLSAVAVEQVNDIFSISYGSHAEQKTESEVNSILNDETVTELLHVTENTETVTKSAPAKAKKAKAKPVKTKAKKATIKIGKSI